MPACLPCTAINAGDAPIGCTAFIATTHVRPLTNLHSSIPEDPVLSLPQPAPDPIRGTRSGAVTQHSDQSPRTLRPW